MGNKEIPHIQLASPIGCSIEASLSVTIPLRLICWLVFGAIIAPPVYSSPWKLYLCQDRPRPRHDSQIIWLYCGHTYPIWEEKSRAPLLLYTYVRLWMHRAPSTPMNWWQSVCSRVIDSGLSSCLSLLLKRYYTCGKRMSLRSGERGKRLPGNYRALLETPKYPSFHLRKQGTLPM